MLTSVSSSPMFEVKLKPTNTNRWIFGSNAANRTAELKCITLALTEHCTHSTKVVFLLWTEFSNTHNYKNNTIVSVINLIRVVSLSIILIHNDWKLENFAKSKL